MIAPAVQASDTPRACPIPSRATPIVAIVVQELPESKDTKAQIMHDEIRKN